MACSPASTNFLRRLLNRRVRCCELCTIIDSLLTESSKPPVDEGKISNIMEMGFSRNAAIRALNASDQKVEPAIEWIMGHMDDPGMLLWRARSVADSLCADLNSDIVEPGSNVDVPEHLIAQLVEFGFAPSQARRALRETVSASSNGRTLSLTHSVRRATTPSVRWTGF